MSGLDWGVRPRPGPHDPMSEEDCRKMTEAEGREVLIVTDHQIHSRTPDGVVWVQWRPDSRFSYSKAVMTHWRFRGKLKETEQGWEEVR